MSEQFQPSTGSPEEWSEAFARVEDYLRAHRLRNRVRLHELSMSLLQEAAARHAANPRENPVTLAVRVAQDRLDQWFADNVGAAALPHERQSALGRVSFLACDGPARYQHVFLETKPLPSELAERLRRWSGQAGPNLEVSRMAPREIDLGLVPEVAEDTWEGLERRPFIRYTLVWAFFGLALAALFFLTRTGVADYFAQ